MKTCNNIRIFVRLGRAISLMLLLLFMSASAAMAQKVLIIANTTYNTSSSGIGDIQSKLIATGKFSQVDGWVPNSSIASADSLSTIAFLHGYDAILYYSSNIQASWNLGVFLAQYVDGGGGLVVALYEEYAYQGLYTLDTNFNNPRYQVIVPDYSAINTAADRLQGVEKTLGEREFPLHPLLQNVSAFDGGLSSPHVRANILSPAAYVVASWNDGTPLIVAREGVGAKMINRVDLNFFPVSSDAVSGKPTLWLPGTDGATIMANALYWVGIYPYDFSADMIVNPANPVSPDLTIKLMGVPIIPTVQITNKGYQIPIPTSVTVRFQITPKGGGSPVYTHDTVLTGANVPSRYTSKVIQFPAYTPMALGVYEDTVTVFNLQPNADMRPSNNVVTSEFTVTLPNNIQTQAFIDPLSNSMASAGTLNPIIIQFRNIGGNDQANVPLVALIKDQTGTVVYADTVYALNWLSRQIRQVQFKNWYVPGGDYTFCGIALLPIDQVRSDDTICESVHVLLYYDASSNSIANPQPNEQKPYTLSWQPTALFQSRGSQDLFNVPARVQIRRCSDGMVVFQADSAISELNAGDRPYQFSFPSQQGTYDISKIAPGCYTMCAMVLYPGDLNRSNDTICTQFSVIDRLKGDIFVGVGQRFPSIHAALDSMRFRGIGGNVRLILTDNSYTENGEDSASVYNYQPLALARVNYYQPTNFMATWTDIATTGTVFTLSSYQTGSKSIPLPFDFPYDGTIIPSGTNISVGATGAISLLNVTPPASNALANSANPGLLCIFSAYIYSGDGNNGDNKDYYKVDGTAPNRVFTVELRRMHFPGSGGGSGSGGLNETNMQVKLYETTGQIEFIYQNHNNDFDGGQGLGITAGIGLNSLSTPSFVSNTYAAGLTATPATDIRWQAIVQPPVTKFGALNFQGIRGLADTATVTWLPNTGVTPRITFTGAEPFCFYFGDQFGGHMTFEGYNPAGAPIPDEFVAEPNKRSITIVNNSANAGAIFAFEEGASNITLKDLVLKNNGRFSSDSSAVVRIYNEQNRNTYLGVGTLTPIRDTVPIHNIRIENCELGNAKYGIRDHALHSQFNVGKSVFMDWRNYNNVFTRNTIGTSASPLSYTGIQFNNEQNLTISHNEISNVNGSLGGFPNVYGIDQPSVLQSDTGNTIGVWVDANRVHALTASGTTYGIAFQQAATIYAVGSGPGTIHSVLPSVASNRTTNNMIFDLRGGTSNYPLLYTTSAATYSTDRDSIFNNSISTRGSQVPGTAPATNIFVAQSKHAFLWNNIIQNTGAGPYVNYSLQLPRPFTSAISSDYNLFDLRGSNTFAMVNEYDLASGTLIQSRSFRRLNDWRTFTQQDLHSVTGDPLFASDSLHEPTALSYTESPASNNGAWLGTSTQLHDFDGDLRLQGNQTPDIGADEFDGFQNTNDLAVLSITQPAGYSATSDTTSVTTQNPLWVTAQVKNLSSQAVFNVPVSATVEVAISGGPWTTIYTGTTSPMNFEVNETKSVTFQGPVVTQAQAQTGVFRITVSVPNDQNNANNSAQKVFRVLLKNNATLVTYNGVSVFGLKNRDSVTAALRRLGIAYDTLDRNAYGSIDIDYTPWWTLIWSSGDPATPINGLQTPSLGAGALSFK